MEEIIAESAKFITSALKLAEKFGVGKTRVNDILKSKIELKNLFEEGWFNADQKRKFPKTDQMVSDWDLQS